MSWKSLLGIDKKDEFIEEVKWHKELYQSFFDKLVSVVNDDIYARWLSGLPELKKGEWDRENKKLDPIIKEGVSKGLNYVALFTIFLQYSKADLYDREHKRKYWVSTILSRKKIDSFPDHNAILAVIEKTDILELE